MELTTIQMFVLLVKVKMISLIALEEAKRKDSQSLNARGSESLSEKNNNFNGYKFVTDNG